MNIEKVNLISKLPLFNDYWSPKIVGELNNQYVKLAKFKGDFVRSHLKNVFDGEKQDFGSEQGAKSAHSPSYVSFLQQSSGSKDAFAAQRIILRWLLKHHHENEDELFFVVEGKLFIELNEKTIELEAGEFVIIPRGVEHKPFAPHEVSVLLFEPTTTSNTGNVKNHLTVSKLEKL